MRIHIIIVFAFIGLAAQAQSIVGSDSTWTEEPLEAKRPRFEVPLDSAFVTAEDGTRIYRSVGWGGLGHSPHTATMYAAVLPGLGQIYNKKYWKLPILYGGVAALCYGIHFNGKHYKMYRNAYRDFIIGDPNNTSWIDVCNDKTNLTPEQVQTTYHDWFENILERKRDSYRRYRDLCYFGLVGVYLIQLIDATVDAHFFNFDVSDDLSIQWQPQLRPEPNNSTAGASICITF